MDVEIYKFITLLKNMLLETSNNIIGIYLFGSLTYGGFDYGRSDIDIVVITKKLLNNYEMDTIKNLHKNLINMNQKWSKRLEVSYTPIEMLQEKYPPEKTRPYYGEGIFYDEATYGNEWLINNYLLYNYGIAIYGPEFKTLIKEPITIKDIQECCINDFYAGWIPKINDINWLKNSHYQSYIVLNICRILYTLHNFETANKKESSKWVKRKYKEWKEIIDEAEGWDYGKTMDKETEVIQFIKFAEEEIKKWKIEKG